VDGKRVKNAGELRSALWEKQGKTGDGAESGKTATADLTVLRAGKETVVQVELQSPTRRVRPARRVAV
jgi:S1-C subfamily serine protease